MGRATQAWYVAFLVVLAFFGVLTGDKVTSWVLERTRAEPATEGDDIQAADNSNAPAASTEPVEPASENLVPNASEKPPVAKPADPPGRSEEDTPLQSRLDAAAVPPANSLTTPSQVATPSPPPVSTSPYTPAAAAAETTPAPLPRVAVDEPELRPVAAPPSALATPLPTAATPEPTAAPRAAAAPPPAAVDVDSGAIRDVLGFYRKAFNELDAVAVQQVWPTVNQRTLDRAFGQLQEQNLSFDKCTIAVKSVLADANCSGTTRFVPRIGSRAAQSEQRQWSFRLRKTDQGQWLIQNLEAR